GILAVTAAPRFFNFASDARASTVQGMEGSVKAASALVYAKALLKGGIPASVDVDEFGTTVTLTTGTRYAAGVISGGITNAVEMSDFSAVIAASVDAAAGSEGVQAGDLLIFPTNNTVVAAGTPLCYVVYRAAVEADPTATPDPIVAAPPVIFSVTNGC
ncbi:MAG: hypothetical protein M1363_01515, partial [Gammaproteobacteria bacterium]|nr:hypothetical protein [Gammaproteobacteria bacterium]